MPETCTCGAQLPSDALFCHKCGKPQREIAEPEHVPPPAPVLTPPAPRVEAPQPSFRNPVAVRIVLGVAAVGTLLSFIPLLNSVAAGYFAVFLYRRRTGARLNMESGVRLGWMTGLAMFFMAAALLALSLGAYRLVSAMPEFQEQLRNLSDPRALELFKTLQNGPELFKVLINLFVFTSLFSMAGGALGSRLAGRS